MATTTQSTAAHSARGAFRNEAFLDFSKEENARNMREALAKVRKELGREYSLIIGGKKITTHDKIRSINPAKPSEVVGIHQKAGAEHVEPAMAAALAAFATWSQVSPDDRVAILFKAADIIRERRLEFNAWLVFEVAKNWAEADADTCETIDFLEYYAREALRLAHSEPSVQLPGERGTLQYIPLGVGAVIPPWNFPFAIMAGMTAAAIVSGNTVILKPSSDSPTIAAKFMEVLDEAGLPAGVVNFCPVLAPHSETQSSRIRKPDSSHSPDRAMWASTSITAPQRRKRDKSGSSERFSRWAAKTRSSWIRKRMWMRRWKVLQSPHLDFRDRNVRRVRAQLWMKKFTTRL